MTLAASLRIEALGPAHLPVARQLCKEAAKWDSLNAVAEEKLFGQGPLQSPPLCLGAWEKGVLVGLAVFSQRWLRLLAVHPEHRGKGVGTALLERCEEACRQKGKSSLRLMEEPGNYLSPGIDTKNQESITWLRKRGFVDCGRNTNLLIPLIGNAALEKRHLAARLERCQALGFEICRLSPTQTKNYSHTVASAFSKGWSYEFTRAASFSPSGVHLALYNGKLASFACHDGNNEGLGWFGPTGTLPEFRGKGLAALLYLRCLEDILDAGHSHCQVSWIGPREFYEKVAGIESEREFLRMKKELS